MRPVYSQANVETFTNGEPEYAPFLESAAISVSPEYGRSVAASALAFVEADPERLQRFLDLTELGP
jgi:hypothetical protein